MAIEYSVGNKAIARYEQMLYVLQCFQKTSVTDALTCACVEEKINIEVRLTNTIRIELNLHFGGNRTKFK